MNDTTLARLIIMAVFGLGLLAVWGGYGCSPASCARYGTLDAQYAAALQEACGKLDDEECAAQCPAAVEAVDARFQPQFEEAERCQAQ